MQVEPSKVVNEKVRQEAERIALAKERRDIQKSQQRASTIKAGLAAAVAIGGTAFKLYQMKNAWDLEQFRKEQRDRENLNRAARAYYEANVTMERTDVARQQQALAVRQQDLAERRAADDRSLLQTVPTALLRSLQGLEAGSRAFNNVVSTISRFVPTNKRDALFSLLTLMSFTGSIAPGATTWAAGKASKNFSKAAFQTATELPANLWEGAKEGVAAGAEKYASTPEPPPPHQNIRGGEPPQYVDGGNLRGSPSGYYQTSPGVTGVYNITMNEKLPFVDATVNDVLKAAAEQAQNLKESINATPHITTADEYLKSMPRRQWGRNEWDLYNSLPRDQRVAIREFLEDLAAQSKKGYKYRKL